MIDLGVENRDTSILSLKTIISNFVFRKAFSLYIITFAYVSLSFNIKEREITWQLNTKLHQKAFENTKLISGKVEELKRHLADLEASAPIYNLI